MVLLKDKNIIEENVPKTCLSGGQGLMTIKDLDKQGTLTPEKEIKARIIAMD